MGILYSTKIKTRKVTKTKKVDKRLGKYKHNGHTHKTLKAKNNCKMKKKKKSMKGGKLKVLSENADKQFFKITNSYKGNYSGKYVNEKKYKDCVSFGIYNFGLNNLIEVYLNDIGKDIAVSVGSGNGVFEKILIDNGVKNIITVDPIDKEFYGKNSKWNKLLKCKDSIKPKYDYVKSLIEKEPKIAGNTNLILIMPTYDTGNKNPFDIEAIKLLKPNKIFMIVELLGASGSDKLLEPLNNTVDAIYDSELLFTDVVNYGKDVGKYKIMTIKKVDVYKSIKVSVVYDMITLKRV